MKDQSRRDPNAPLSTEAVLENSGWIRRVAASLVGCRQDAEDLAQEVWLRSLQRPAPAGVAPRAWLTGILRRTSVESNRANRARRQREQAVAHTRARGEQELNRELERQVDIERGLVERVMALDEPLRRTILLRYFQELDVGTIAELEGLSPAGVQSRLHRAYERIRQQLKGAPGTSAGLWFASAARGSLARDAGAEDPLTRAAEHASSWKAGSLKVGASAAILAATGALGLMIVKDDPGAGVSVPISAESPNGLLASPVDLATIRSVKPRSDEERRLVQNEPSERLTRPQEEPPPSAPVETEKPGTGQLMFHVAPPLGVTHDGTAETQTALTLHRGKRQFANGLPEVLRAPLGTPIVHAEVKLGEHWTVTGRVGSRWELKSATFEGPTVPGETKRMDLALDDPWGAFTGTAVLQVGEAFQESMRLRAEAYDDEGQLLPSFFRTTLDPKSQRFYAALRPGSSTGAARRIRFELTFRASSQAPLEAWHEGSLPEPGAMIEIGSLPFAPAEQVLRGIVKDEAGQPVEGAKVLAWRPSELPGVAWEPNFECGGKTAQDGTFVIPRPQLLTGYRIAAKVGKEALSPLAQVTDPDQLIELTIRPARSLAGRLAPAQGLDFSRLSMRIQVRERGVKTPSLRLWVEPDAEGNFTIGGLASQEVDLTLQSGVDGVTAAQLEGIKLVDGAPDPRLMPWRWSSTTRAVNLRVLDASGEPLKYGRAWVPGSPSQAFKGGQLSVLLPKKAEEITLKAAGHRDLTLRVATLPDSVALESALLVGLTLHDPKGRLKGYRAQLHLADQPDRKTLSASGSRERRDTFDRELWSRRQELVAGQSVRFELRAPGTYAVSFFAPGERFEMDPKDLPPGLRGLRLGVEPRAVEQPFHLDASR